MTNHYVPPESELARKRRLGEKLTPIGAVLTCGGLIGILLASILKVVWLGILGGPIASLSWLALVTGVGCLVAGYLLAKAARRSDV